MPINYVRARTSKAAHQSLTEDNDGVKVNVNVVYIC